MAAQLRPNRLDVTDRFPMLGFTIRTDSPPCVAEVVIATDPGLFASKEGRSPSNFYSSREHGLLSIPRGEAVYVVKPEVVARFIHAERLFFGLATATPPAANDWRVDVMPTGESPYISLSGLSDRALRRVRMFPLRGGAGYAANGARTQLEWAGDQAQPGTSPAPASPQAPAAVPANGAPAANGGPAPAADPAPAPAPAADVPYDDGFGPLPPLKPAGEAPAAPAVAAQSYAFEVDPDTMGIEGPVLDEPVEPQSMALGNRPRALTEAEYSGVTRIMPSPAYSDGRRGQAIDRIVIHITGAPQSPYIGSWFAREEANSSAHYMVDQGGEIIQFVREQDTAWHAGPANRRSIGIEHVAIQQGGARYPRRDGTYQTFPYTPPTDAEYRASAALVAHLCHKYGLTPDRTTIIGHREADPNTSHTVCPDGAWDWDAYMALVAECHAALSTSQGLSALLPAGRWKGASALGAGGETVEIKYRVFIPSPLIKGPASDYDLGPIASGEDFSGDNRGFSYDQGTSRAEITATLVLDAQSGISGLRIADRRWGESKAYDSTYTYHVDGKPDWWMDRHAGLDPSRRGTLPVSDGNLNIVRGASGTTRNILAYTSQSSVVSIKVAGALPLVSPSPDIDADIAVYLKRGPGGNIQAMVVGDHDGFPCHELYINRQRVYSYDPVAAGNDPTSLFPPTDREVSTDWIDIPSLSAAQSQSLAQGLDAEDWSINWDDVFPVGQPTNMSCWATAAAMIDGWKRRQSVSIDAIAEFDNLSTRNGLPPESAARFAEYIGFTVHPNACYTAEGFRDMLEANGPVWVAARVPSLHAIVVTGMYRKDGKYYVRITDPWDRVVGTPGSPGSYADTHVTGSQYIMSYEAFTAEFEAAGDLDFAQLLHTGGTHGHTINRGSASSAGYALALKSRSLDAGDWSVNWDDVQRIAQPTDSSCWATAAAMVLGWRDRMSVSPELLAKYHGLTSSLTTGLAPGDKQAFADAIGLVVHPNACYTPEGFRDVLEANGPVWVTAKVPGVHAIVVTGLYRENGNYFVRITDPWDRVVGTPGSPGAYADTHLTGSQYIMGYDAFTAEFEAAGDIDRIQLLHSGGTHGHAINRGSASAAGYAQALNDAGVQPAPADGASSAPVSVALPTGNGGDASLGAGTSLTRSVTEKNGRRYDLAQLAGFVQPDNALAGGAGMPPLKGERVMLDDWPYIDGPSGRTQAGVAIDWQYRNGSVGEIAVLPIDGQVLDGWAASVRADIAPNGSTPDKAGLKIRVTTTFSRPGEEDQVAVSDVTLSGDGRHATVHGADRAPEPALPPGEAATGDGADASVQPQLATA